MRSRMAIISIMVATIVFYIITSQAVLMRGAFVRYNSPSTRSFATPESSVLAMLRGQILSATLPRLPLPVAPKRETR